MFADDLVGIAGAVGADEFPLLLSPQQQVPVVAVEVIEVEALASTLAGGAEGDLAQAAKFFEQMRHLFGPRRIDRELVVLGQQTVRGKRLNIGKQKITRNSRRNLLLRFAWKRGAHLGGNGNLLLSPIREQVRAKAKVLSCLLVVFEITDQLRRNRAAHPH